MLFRRAITFRETVLSHFQSKKHSLSLMILRAVHNEMEAVRGLLLGSNHKPTSSFYDRSLHHSPLHTSIVDQSNDYKIDIVDDETWQVSRGFADIWSDTKAPSLVTDASCVNSAPPTLQDADFDDIDDLRMCGNLFYKLDRDSKEFEEYSFDFHRRKSSQRKGDRKEGKPTETPNSNSGHSQSKLRETPRNAAVPSVQRFPKSDQMDGKKQRTQTFNQLTGPYHEPFCLDIYISKASVRACIVHRATSKVVAVAHSISKDMKFDLGSTKNAAACVAVGKVLAQRALADDIHNVVYTPRSGEKLEGKLQSVLHSVINNGVAVKVKIKQRKVRKGSLQSTYYKHG